MAEDSQRLAEIEAWFEAHGYLLVTDQSGKLWIAAVLRQDVRVGVGDVAGEGATELEAAEAALAKYEAQERRVVGADLAAEFSIRALVTADLSAEYAVVELPFGVEAEKLAVDFGWRIDFIEEPDGQVRGFLRDWETHEVLKSYLGADFQDAYLGLGVDTHPPSAEGRQGRRGDASDPRVR